MIHINGHTLCFDLGDGLYASEGKSQANKADNMKLC